MARYGTDYCSSKRIGKRSTVAGFGWLVRVGARVVGVGGKSEEGEGRGRAKDAEEVVGVECSSGMGNTGTTSPAYPQAHPSLSIQHRQLVGCLCFVPGLFCHQECYSPLF